MAELSRSGGGGVGLCPSIPHRAILGLVRAAVGGHAGETLVADLGNSNPDDLVRIAVFNYVHVVLAGAFDRFPELAGAVPRDLVIFAEEMHTANQRRNASIRQQLVDIGSALSGEGIRAVALKGGAELLSPLYPEPAYRFLSDADILVAEHHLDKAVAAVRALGAVEGQREATDKPFQHHYWPLHHADWPVPVELHLSVGRPDVSKVLAAKDILRRADFIPGTGLGVPSRAHRMAHSALHAQVSSGNYAAGLLSLRDAMEFEVLTRSLGEAEISQARELLDRADMRQPWDALAAASTLVFGGQAQHEAFAPDARRWAETAIVNFGRPRQQRAVAMVRWATGRAGEFIGNPEQRRRYLRFLTHPGLLRNALAQHLEKWRRMR